MHTDTAHPSASLNHLVTKQLQVCFPHVASTRDEIDDVKGFPQCRNYPRHGLVRCGSQLTVPTHPKLPPHRHLLTHILHTSTREQEQCCGSEKKWVTALCCPQAKAEERMTTVGALKPWPYPQLSSSTDAGTTLEKHSTHRFTPPPLLLLHTSPTRTCVCLSFFQSHTTPHATCSNSAHSNPTAQREKATYGSEVAAGIGELGEDGVASCHQGVDE